ncbi:hypothetical protein OF83DRAFT_1195866 [Amylostereum chailletii]|nr:hypothetical protein OF83DRAFT_1195866 [Amylostereum chailletii]
MPAASFPLKQVSAYANGKGLDHIENALFYKFCTSSDESDVLNDDHRGRTRSAGLSEFGVRISQVGWITHMKVEDEDMRLPPPHCFSEMRVVTHKARPLGKFNTFLSLQPRKRRWFHRAHCRHNSDEEQWSKVGMDPWKRRVSEHRSKNIDDALRVQLENEARMSSQPQEKCPSGLPFVRFPLLVPVRPGYGTCWDLLNASRLDMRHGCKTKL